MRHFPLLFQDIALCFPHKICFEGLTTQILPKDRIGIIGQNGSGKSSLLKMIQGELDPSRGSLNIPSNVVIGHLPQIIENFDTLSGGERLNKALSHALLSKPNLLLLDEPTNHLDLRNRRALLRFLETYRGTLVIATHDEELLKTCTHTLWHIEGQKVHIFQGSYDHYKQERHAHRTALEHRLFQLQQQKKASHKALMQEQARAKTSRERGEKHIHERKWPTIVSHAKAHRAAVTAGRKKKFISTRKDELTKELSSLRIPERLTPHFFLSCGKITDRVLLSVKEGSVGCTTTPLLCGINLSLRGAERLALQGSNGTGKSTLLKALSGEETLYYGGGWSLPHPRDIAMLDQHYATLTPQHTVLENLEKYVPSWSSLQLRQHLNDFLFRKNEEVGALVSTLSGGEKARLSLAQIAANTPKLLLLDEITNNLDLETKEHVIQALTAYPGALVVISHEADFLEAIGIETYYDVEQSTKQEKEK